MKILIWILTFQMALDGLADAIKARDVRSAVELAHDITRMADAFASLVRLGPSSHGIGKLTRMCVGIMGKPSRALLERAAREGNNAFVFHSGYDSGTVANLAVRYGRKKLLEKVLRRDPMCFKKVSYGSIQTAFHRGHLKCVDRVLFLNLENRVFNSHILFDAVYGFDHEFAGYLVENLFAFPYDKDVFPAILMFVNPGGRMWSALGFDKSDEFIWSCMNNDHRRAGATVQFANPDDILRYDVVNMCIRNPDTNPKIIRILLDQIRYFGSELRESFVVALKEGSKSTMNCFLGYLADDREAFVDQVLRSTTATPDEVVNERSSPS